MLANHHIHTPLVDARSRDYASSRAAMGHASANDGNCAIDSLRTPNGVRTRIARAIGWIHSEARGPTAQAPSAMPAPRSATTPYAPCNSRP